MSAFDNLAGNKSGRKFNNIQPEVDNLPKHIEKDKQVIKRVFTLAGTTKSGYDFSSLVKGQPVNLVLDPYGIHTKPHPDATAIAVMDMDNKHIAYIKSEQAKKLYDYLDKKILTPIAAVQEVKGGGDFNYGVDIRVQFTEN